MLPMIDLISDVHFAKQLEARHCESGRLSFSHNDNYYGHNSYINALREYLTLEEAYKMNSKKYW